MTAIAADSLICDSKAIGSVWEERFGRDSTFIPYGADIHSGTPAGILEASGLSQHGPYVLVVARLAPENNVELTLDALDALGTQAPHAIVVGSANFASPIEDRLRQMQATGIVSWLGHVDNQRLLTELWARCAVYVHGHSVGGTNPALLQALGAGAPTLALDTPFNAEVLPHADQLFQASAAELASRIDSIVGAPAVQAKLSERGRKIISERYSWDGVCESYLQVLVTLAERKHRGALKGQLGSRSSAAS